MKLTLGMSNLKFSLSESHPNKMIIEGCITKINQASTGAPIGSDGKLIVFTKESVEKCLSTYEMMPVNCSFPDDWDWSWSPGTQVFTGHGDINIGVIEKVWTEDEDLMAKIVVWKALFPDISLMTVNARDALGFSIECTADKTHVSTEDGFMYIDEFTGLGCAMLFKNTAAFSGTYIKELVASRTKEKVEDNMNEEQMKTLLESLLASMKEELTGVKASVETMVSEVKTEVDKANSEIQTLAVSLAETKEELKASKEAPAVQASAAPAVEPPTPTVIAAGQAVVPNGDFAGTPKTKKQRIAEVWASDKSMQDKMKEVVRINADIEQK